MDKGLESLRTREGCSRGRAGEEAALAPGIPTGWRGSQH